MLVLGLSSLCISGYPNRKARHASIKPPSSPWKLFEGWGCRLSTHETHRVGNDVVLRHFAHFGGRSSIRDEHKRLAEYSWMTLDVFLVSRRRVCVRAVTVCHIPGNSDQKRRRLAACLRNEYRSPAGRERTTAMSPTGDRVAVKGLHFVLGFWHLRDKFTNALRAFGRVPVPTDS
jgi:hypothetical protein